MSHKIRVTLGANFKRESVLIDPNVSAAEPSINAENVGQAKQNPEANIIARGTSVRDVLKKVYG